MINKNKQKGVAIFDVDGTLIDSGKKLANDTIQAFSRLGYSITPEEAGIDWRELTQKYQIPFEEFDRALSQRKSWQDSLKDGEVTLFPETIRVLNELTERGIRLGILSLSIPKYTEAKLGYFNLIRYFEQIETVSPFSGKSKDKGAIDLIRRLNPKTLERADFIGDRSGDVVCEQAVKRAFSDYNLTTRGIYINRKGQKLDGYTSIQNLEEILKLV